MSYSQTINLVVGDTLPTLTFTLRDKNTAASGQTLDENNPASWAPLDLTGSTVLFRIRALNSTVVTAELTCTLTVPAEGKVSTDFPTGTLDAAGTFEGEIEVTFSGGAIHTVYDLIKLKVRAGFD